MPPPVPKQRAFPNLNKGSRSVASGFQGAWQTKELTGIQTEFVEAYFKNGGVAADAAEKIGQPKAHGAGHMNSPRVLREIAVRGAIIAKGANITAEDVIHNLLRIGAAAEDAGQYAPAIKAQELVGKQIGMFIERSININVDGNKAHLAALKARMAERVAHATTNVIPFKVDPFAGL